MLRNILERVFNLYLDQFFLTYKICYFVLFCLLFFFGWNPYFYSVFSKKYKIKETQKNKKHTICEHNCANCSCSSVLFSAFVIFAVFSISICLKMFLFGFPKSKNTKNQRKQNKKQEQKDDKRCKAKTNERLWFKTKQDNKQNNRNQRTTKVNKTKRKSKNQKQKWQKQKGRKQERRRQREKKKRRKWNKATEKQRETQKKYTKMPFLGGKTGFFLAEAKTKKQKKQKKQKTKKTKTNKIRRV